MEFFDIYDDNRIFTGRKVERGTALSDNENRMVVHLCIFNSNGEMLIQQRQSFKKSWANMWDISLGGCSQAGETSRDAVHRECLEELGVDYDFSKVRPHLTNNFEHGFDDFYIIHLDLDIEKLVKLSKRMSGRDIKEKILKTALHNAIINDKEKVTMDDIYFALEINKYKKEEIKGMFE